jgi:hypothetical protein
VEQAVNEPQGGDMETYLRPAVEVPFESLYLDPNNPRLYPDDPPGYEDVQKLFDLELQKLLEQRVIDEFGVDELMQAVVGNGWMPIDAIVVWEHPDGSQRNVVLEGNRRTVTLRRIRERLPKEQQKLERMRGGRTRVAQHDLRAQERLVEILEQIIADTARISVLPLDAASQDELEHKLPRVLAVRHITGAKGWGNYAEDLWLLQRYHQLFEDTFPDQDLRWEPSIIERVADEASLGKTKARRQLMAASAFSHFKAEFEDLLPAEEEFKASDYYLFENIVKKPWLRERFGLSENDLNLPEDRERVLFEWVFKLPRPRSAEDNDNVFYRHENVLLWEKIKRYDDDHGTAFAQRFDVENPESAPRMREVEADYLAHMARKKPGDVLENLLHHLGTISEATIEEEGEFLAQQLQRLEKRTQVLLRMITVADAA